MAHDLEMLANGNASMAYAGDVPWHGLGKRVPADLTPEQMLEAAGLDWTVSKRPLTYLGSDGKARPAPKVALVRDSDDKLLSMVGPEWESIQNAEAAGFYHEFVMAGDMEMHTAGSLKGGEIVWFLAKCSEAIEVIPGKDKIESYLLFSNFHQFGQSTDIRFTDIRVVCNNTFTLANSKDVKNGVKIHHRNKFDPEKVKEVMGLSRNHLHIYKEKAQFLLSKAASDDAVSEYFDRLFPLTTKEKGPKAKTHSRASDALYSDIIGTQPGAELGDGSWWQAFNAVTYFTDHKTGKNVDKRLTSAWYGPNRTVKEEAMELALEYANKA